jgi:antitoxin CptB
MSFNIDELKKKIIYRSNYRGSKEMDTLLSSFTKTYIDKLNNDDLLDLCDLLDLDDENLYKLNQGQNLTISVSENNITNLFKNYIYKN